MQMFLHFFIQLLPCLKTLQPSITLINQIEDSHPVKEITSNPVLLLERGYKKVANNQVNSDIT